MVAPANPLPEALGWSGSGRREVETGLVVLYLRNGGALGLPPLPLLRGLGRLGRLVRVQIAVLPPHRELPSLTGRPRQYFCATYPPRAKSKRFGLYLVGCPLFCFLALAFIGPPSGQSRIENTPSPRPPPLARVVYRRRRQTHR